MKLIFRMFLSSKFGKNNPLKYIRKGPKIVTDMEVFMASLIMNVDENGVDGYDTKPRVTMTIIDGVRCGSNTSNHSKKPIEDELSF